MNEVEARDLLVEAGALLSGHFLLTSGRHSDVYGEKARVFERPPLTMRYAEEMASWYRGIDVVVSPAVGALPLGFAVALAARARFVFAEREQGRMALRRGFRIERGERTLVVEDVVTTGGSAAEVVELVRHAGGESLGVAALVDRSSDALPFPLRAVVRVEATSYAAGECPLCARGVPLEERGSRAITGGGPAG